MSCRLIKRFSICPWFRLWVVRVSIPLCSPKNTSLWNTWLATSCCIPRAPKSTSNILEFLQRVVVGPARSCLRHGFDIIWCRESKCIVSAVVAVVEGGRGVFVKRGARGVVVNRRQISGQADQEPKKRGVVQQLSDGCIGIV